MLALLAVQVLGSDLVRQEAQALRADAAAAVGAEGTAQQAMMVQCQPGMYDKRKGEFFRISSEKDCQPCALDPDGKPNGMSGDFDADGVFVPGCKTCDLLATRSDAAEPVAQCTSCHNKDVLLVDEHGRARCFSRSAIVAPAPACIAKRPQYEDECASVRPPSEETCEAKPQLRRPDGGKKCYFDPGYSDLCTPAKQTHELPAQLRPLDKGAIWDVSFDDGATWNAVPVRLKDIEVLSDDTFDPENPDRTMRTAAWKASQYGFNSAQFPESPIMHGARIMMIVFNPKSENLKQEMVSLTAAGGSGLVDGSTTLSFILGPEDHIMESEEHPGILKMVSSTKHSGQFHQSSTATLLTMTRGLVNLMETEPDLMHIPSRKMPYLPLVRLSASNMKALGACMEIIHERSKDFGLPCWEGQRGELAFEALNHADDYRRQHTSALNQLRAALREADSDPEPTAAAQARVRAAMQAFPRQTSAKELQGHLEKASAGRLPWKTWSAGLADVGSFGASTRIAAAEAKSDGLRTEFKGGGSPSSNPFFGSWT